MNPPLAYLTSTFSTLWREYRGTLFFVLFVLIPVKSSLADWNWVPTGSMNPTIMEGDLIYVNKLAYDLRAPLTLHRITSWSNPERGDITVLLSPEDGTRLVKRIIGLPGDEIEMINNVLFINGVQLEYTPLRKGNIDQWKSDLKAHSVFAEEHLGNGRHAVMSVPRCTTDKRNVNKLLVPEGAYFVMGDNRDLSKDSRYFGFAKREQILGKATHTLLSFDMLNTYQPRLERFFSALD